ncbi:hypothetical protein Tco_0981032, partial [Tanacetum coccineum]
RVGDGLRTRFWNDLWISDGLLRDRFPRLFALEMDKEVLVAVKLGASSVADSFRRGVCDGILSPLCDADVEDVHHVMFRCDMALSVLCKICWW